ncbi:hypothetical protein J2W32_000349 [Variovorax boronicumulans]|uniref:Uncharacterized protein n=1 Tax=Variovorax boronicumulans TaxID=436515 RepID=A0AAW8CU53_9BURK|nr:hypothetical protein [Variovorax boronicumulans]MDP9891252.1 hypothetical protein [Variovorax boronicumulans]MDQ0051320.1 hypothetical protein [Variovorax boronicumulans]
MVIPFPAAVAAPQPLSTLLDRCIGFLEGFEDDPEQCVAPLLAQLRRANVPGLQALHVPRVGRVIANPRSEFIFTYHGSSDEFAFLTDRQHGEDEKGRYRWSAQRYDDTGRIWRTRGLGVVDDFGNLVEVPQ